MPEYRPFRSSMKAGVSGRAGDAAPPPRPWKQPLPPAAAQGFLRMSSPQKQQPIPAPVRKGDPPPRQWKQPPPPQPSKKS
jgi:hypothetical protein